MMGTRVSQDEAYAALAWCIFGTKCKDGHTVYPTPEEALARIRDNIDVLYDPSTEIGKDFAKHNGNERRSEQLALNLAS